MTPGVSCMTFFSFDAYVQASSSLTTYIYSPVKVDAVFFESDPKSLHMCSMSPFRTFEERFLFPPSDFFVIWDFLGNLGHLGAQHFRRTNIKQKRRS